MASERVVGLSVDGRHRFSKVPVGSVRLVEGVGIEGDAHAGETVQHRSRVARDPSQPNLRQVHLLHAEFLDAARESGFDIGQGGLGENILTRNLDLLGLPANTRLRIGDHAVVRVTGLRNPCAQIEDYRPGLLKIAVSLDANGGVVRRAGVMGVVERGGVVSTEDRIVVEFPDGPHRALDVV